MLRNRAAYDQGLEQYSRSILSFIDFQVDSDGRMTVKNAAVHLYRFFDATAQVERLYRCIQETIHYRSLMSPSHRLGILNRKVSSNPARSITRRREDNNRVRFLTEDEKERRKVIEAKWPSHLPRLDVTIDTGIRKGANTGLRGTW